MEKNSAFHTSPSVLGDVYYCAVMHPLTRVLTCHKEGTFWYSNIWEDELADHSGTLLVQPCRAGVKIPTWKSSQAGDWKV